MTAVVILAVLGAVAPAKSEPDLKLVFEEESRAFVAPGVRFGSRSQELSFVLGVARVDRHLLTERPARPPDRRPGGEWFTAGLRVDLIASGWSPAAVHGLGSLSFGGWSWEFFPVGFEVAGGYGGSSKVGYGVIEASFLVGISSRFELAFTGRTTLGSVQPEWLSNWLIGARYGFDIATFAKRTVTKEFLER